MYLDLNEPTRDNETPQGNLHQPISGTIAGNKVSISVLQVPDHRNSLLHISEYCNEVSEVSAASGTRTS
jgi:hypothetical protein